MTNLITTMKKEQEYLEQVKQQVEEDIRQEHKDKLIGKLRIQKKGNSVQYYHVKEEQAYIPKKNITLARNLAQRDYDKKLLKRIELYEKNGIYPGDELLFSWETSTVPVNMKIVEGMMKKFLV